MSIHQVNPNILIQEVSEARNTHACSNDYNHIPKEFLPIDKVWLICQGSKPGRPN